MRMMTLGGLILVSVVVSVPATGQWLTHPTSGIPRTRDGTTGPRGTGSQNG